MEDSDSSRNVQELDHNRDGHQVSVVVQRETPTIKPPEAQPPPSTSTESPPTQPPIATPPHQNRRRLILIILAVVGLIVAAIFGLRWWQFMQTHQETDDAYVTGDINPVNARITGTVAEVLVEDNQIVKKGALLVKLDPKDYEVSLQQTKASLEAAREQANVAQANIGVVRTNAQGLTTSAQGNIDAARASISTAQATVAEAQAGVPAAQAQLRQVEANLVRSQLDYQRYTSLEQSGASPKQQLDIAKANYDALVAQRNSAEEQVKQAQAKVAEAQQNLTNAQAKFAATKGNLQQANSSSQLTQVNQQQYKAALAAIAQADAQLKNAQLQLSYTDITAPANGRVGNKTVQVGQRVQPGQTLMSLVEQDPWVVANFKETQLEKMQPGQLVEIKIDSLHSQTFLGKVNSFAPASGARFALLPPDNATGNFTKIVQRVPVKIVFDPQSIRGYESKIAPGMSAVITVTLH